ncbi:MAG: hypothetical protein AAGE89_09655, partial [Pseudomonadota bacterium]
MTFRLRENLSGNFVKIAGFAFLVFLVSTLPLRAGVADNLQHLLERQSITVFASAYDTAPLRAAYEARGFDPVWVNDNGVSERGYDLVKVLS